MQDLRGLPTRLVDGYKLGALKYKGGKKRRNTPADTKQRRLKLDSLNFGLETDTNMAGDEAP